MTTPSDPPDMLPDDDRAIALADQRVAAEQQAYDAAVAARAELGFAEAGYTAKVRLQVLQAEMVIEEAADRLAKSLKIVEAVRYQRDVRARAAYRERTRPRRRAALTAARALAEALHADLVDRDALATALGLASGTGGHPYANAVALVAALDYYCRELDPPPPPAIPPVPAGMVRVRTLKQHWNHDARYGIPFGVNDEYCMRVEQLPDATAEGLVEAVEAGG